MAATALDDSQRTLLKDIRRAALDILARREHSTLELKRKLDRRFGFSDLTGQVLEQLRSDKLLSDERFAESYIRYRSRAGFGPQRIAKELGERGVSDLLASALVGEYDSEWVAAAKRERTKKFGEVLPVNQEDRLKQMRFLHYRGFSYEIIDQVVED